MNARDSKLTALLFNECINSQDIKGLANLMTEDHALVINRGGEVEVVKPKARTIEAWREFFGMFPEYRNTFTRIESRENEVTIAGYAFWSEDEPYDPALWTAKIENDLVARWTVYGDTEENRIKLGILLK